MGYTATARPADSMTVHQTEDSAMPYFLLLPYDASESFADFSPEEMQALVGRYIEWTNGLRDRGILAGNNKLKDNEGRVLRREADQVVVRDGPYAETKEVIGGYWLIEAPDYDAAVALARDCPHVEFGTLEIRQVDDLGG